MLTILNDIHISANRSAGTTPATAQQIKTRTLEKFASLLPVYGDLMILGDLFDTNNINAGDLFTTYELLSDWMHYKPGSHLYLVRGNHDVSKTSSQLSSFDLLCKLLQARFDNLTVVADGGQLTPYGYVIPHMPNQDLFDLELERVPECDYLFVHCNIDNNFAAQSDQSLNLSREQIAATKAKHIVCAHEHHARNLGKVTIPGNQIATSVADWLSPSDKQFAVIEDGVLSLRTCAKRPEEFCEMPWNAIVDTDAPFVRISGDASAEQAAEALAAVAAYRRRSNALVVTNAVKIATVDGENYEDAVANMANFDVMSMLREVLDKSDMVILEGLK